MIHLWKWSKLFACIRCNRNKGSCNGFTQQGWEATYFRWWGLCCELGRLRFVHHAVPSNCNPIPSSLFYDVMDPYFVFSSPRCFLILFNFNPKSLISFYDGDTTENVQSNERAVSLFFLPRLHSTCRMYDWFAETVKHARQKSVWRSAQGHTGCLTEWVWRIFSRWNLLCVRAIATTSIFIRVADTNANQNDWYIHPLGQ